MNSREQAHAEDRKALRSMEQRPLLLVFLAVVAVIASTALVYGIANRNSQSQLQTAQAQIRALSEQAGAAAAKAQTAADAAAKAQMTQCGFYHDLSLLPLTSTSSQALLQIIAHSRTSFEGLGCAPALPQPDPRVAALLKAGH